jgi:hypothetical protein
VMVHIIPDAGMRLEVGRGLGVFEVPESKSAIRISVFLLVMEI